MKLSIQQVKILSEIINSLHSLSKTDHDKDVSQFVTRVAKEIIWLTSSRGYEEGKLRLIKK